MAQGKTRARRKVADKATEPRDQLAEPVVLSGGMPKLIVRIHDDVEAYIEGKLVKPGQTCELDFGTATVLVAEGKGTVEGSVAPS